MSADANFNVVVFSVVLNGETFEVVGHAPTRADNCVRSCWAAATAQRGIKPSDVQKIYSEWEPSELDKAFLDATFAKDLKVSYSFDRPSTDEGWERAIREAQQTIQNRLDKKPPAKRWWEFWK